MSLPALCCLMPTVRLTISAALLLILQGIECVSSRLEAARANMRTLRERLSCSMPTGLSVR